MKFIRTIINKKFVIGFFIFGIIAFVIGQYIWNAVMAFTAGIFSISLITLVLHFIDDKALGDADTYEQIVTNGNLAYAIYFLAMALCVIAAYAIPFLVFFTF